jgi:hypothetical protein
MFFGGEICQMNDDPSGVGKSRVLEKAKDPTNLLLAKAFNSKNITSHSPN